MTKLTRFFATCLLLVSISAVAFADGEGGTTQGPPAPTPPPVADCIGCSEPEASEPSQSAQDWSVDSVSVADIFAIWLVASIL